jgi:hypothetical protein
MAAWVAAESVKIWQSTQHLHPDRMEVGERTDDFGLGGEDSNSAFGFFPAALGNASEVIAPKYWSSWNISDGFWAMEMDKCHRFTYIDREGKE